MKKYIIFLVILSLLTQEALGIEVQRPSPFVRETVTAEDGYIKIADSETVITGAWDCDQSGTYFDWYVNCNSKFWNYAEEGHASSLTRRTSSDKPYSYVSSVSGSDTAITFTTAVSSTLMFDLKDKYFRATITDAGGISFVDSITSADAGTYALNSVFNRGGAKETRLTVSDGETVTIEIYPSTLQPNIMVVLVDGVKTEVDIANWDAVYLHLGTHSGTEVINARYLLLYNCEIGEGQALATLSYGAGETISLTAEGKLSEVPYKLITFCTTHQPLIQQSGGSREDSNEIYYSLYKGQTLVVPQDTIWTLFFVIDTKGLPVQCSADMVDLETMECKDVNAYITFLRQGTLDLETGTLIVEPISVVETITGEEGIYDLQNNSAIFYEETGITCKDDDLEFSTVDDGCVEDLQVSGVRTEAECTAQGEGYVWYSNTYECIKDECENENADPVYEDGKLVRCVIPSEEALEVSTGVTDADCQEKVGENAYALFNDEGKGYACAIQEVLTNTVYYCGGEITSSEQVCAADQIEDIQSTVISVVDKSDLEEKGVNTVLMMVVIILLIIAIVGAFLFWLKSR